jgi:hypothetical protein
MPADVMAGMRRRWAAALAALHRLVVDSGARIDAGTPGARHPPASRSHGTGLRTPAPAVERHTRE